MSSPAPSSRHSAAPLILGESAMARQVRAFDWAATPLGPIERWPQSLLIAVGICLNSRFPMFVWWGDELINIYNDGYVPMLGARHPAALGRPARASWADIWSEVGPQADLVMKKGEATWNERVLLRMERHGYPEDTWFTWSYSPIRDESGSVGGLFCAVTEDTMRVLAERQRDRLADEQRRAQVRDQFLVRLDDATRRLSDADEIILASATVLGQHLQVDRCAYADVEDDEDTMNLIGNYRRSEEVSSIVGRLRFRDFGAEVLALMRADKAYVVDDVDTHQPPVSRLEPYRATQIQAVICMPLHKAGRFVAAMAVHSMTPRKWKGEEVELVRLVANRCWESLQRSRVTQTLRASEAALRDADRRKDEFLAMLAHELRNPLAPVSNALQALRLSADDGMRRYAQDVMERQVRQLVRLVDDLLDVSRITRGKIALQKEPVTLAAVVDAAVETVRPLLDQRGQTLEVQVPGGIWLDADKARLSQVFANILHNAAKFSLPEGRIEVRAQKGTDGVTVTVRDYGIGIPPEELGSIFDMFSQGDSSIERAEGGLGLGLTIVKNLVDLHGGRIEAASQGAGSGATFSVHLPTRAGSPTPTSDRAPPAKAHAAGLRLLVVDDNRDSAESLGAMLRLLGHKVELRFDGPSALEAANQFRPQVVFLDIGMPGMNGFDVCRGLRARSPAGELVVVAQTGWGDEEQRARAKEAGFDHHLVKPLDAATLQALLAAVAQNLR